MAMAVIQRRAVTCISQWWKQFKLTRRVEALATIKRYVLAIDSPTLHIEESIYMNLTMILNQQSKSLRFIEQNLKFDFKNPLEIDNSFMSNSANIMLAGDSVINDNLNLTGTNDEPSQDQMSWLTSNIAQTWSIVYANTTSETHRYKFNPVPNWLWG
jgi:hypothetical protein